MIVLVAFSTIEGQTGKIAQTIAEWIDAAGHKSVLADLAQPGFMIPAGIDAAVLCAPIHGGRYPQPMIRFVQDWKSDLASVPCALVTVSLAIASENDDERKEAILYPGHMARETGWVPPIQHNAAGALKYLEYDFFKRWMLRRISQSEGGPVDTTRDHELTDWSALQTFVQSFLAEAAKRN